MAKKPAEPKVRTRLVPAQVAKALAEGGAGIDSGLLLKSLIDCWGGPVRFSRDIHQEFQDAKPGSLTRQRILEMMTRLTVQVTNQEIAKPKAVSDLTDAELVEAAQTIMEKLANGTSQRPPGTPQA
jgi:hypothetical protein